ncbi:MAG TPA: flagellar brake protein [Limnochordales bacterium]
MQVNDRVLLEVPEGPWAGQYSTRVEHVGERRMALLAPDVRGVPLIVPEGTELFVTALKVDPVRGGRFRARVRAVGGLERDQQARLLVVEVLGWERVQLRSFIRAPALLKVRCRLVDPQKKAPWFTAETRDVGGGGLLLWLPKPLDPGTRLEMVLELPKRAVRAVGEVVRVVEQPADSAAGSGAGVAVQFVDIAESDRDRIIGFVLRRQAEIRRLQSQ